MLTAAEENNATRWITIAQRDHALTAELAGPLLRVVRFFTRRQPQRGGGHSPINARILTVVSSLCSTSPCARLANQFREGGRQQPRHRRHDIPLGGGRQRESPDAPARPARRLKGNPLPYFNKAIMMPAVASYFRSAVSAGGGAVKTSPHEWHRNFRNSWTVAVKGGCPVIRTSTPATFS